MFSRLLQRAVVARQQQTRLMKRPFSTTPTTPAAAATETTAAAPVTSEPAAVATTKCQPFNFCGTKSTTETACGTTTTTTASKGCCFTQCAKCVVSSIVKFQNWKYEPITRFTVTMGLVYAYWSQIPKQKYYYPTIWFPIDTVYHPPYASRRKE